MSTTRTSPFLFVWRHGGERVFLTGDFLGWRADGLELQKVVPPGSKEGDEDSSWKSAGSAKHEHGDEDSEEQSTFALRVWVPVGRRVEYKFVVHREGGDVDEWAYAPEQPFQQDEFGNVNNFFVLVDGEEGGGGEEGEKVGKEVGTIEVGDVDAAALLERHPQLSSEVPLPIAPMIGGGRPSERSRSFAAGVPLRWHSFCTPWEANAAIELGGGEEDGSLVKIPLEPTYEPPPADAEGGEGEGGGGGGGGGEKDGEEAVGISLGGEEEVGKEVEEVGGERSAGASPVGSVERSVDDVTQRLDARRFHDEFDLSATEKHGLRRVTSTSDVKAMKEDGSGVFEEVDVSRERSASGGLVVEERRRARSVDGRPSMLREGHVPRPPLSTSFRTLTQATATVQRDGKMVVAMVGLPARGKTYIARALRRHLCWMGIRAAIFNVGNVRREILGPAQRHSFFSATNPVGLQQRHDMAVAAFRQMVRALHTKVDVAIFDATNSTTDRRLWLKESIRKCFGGKERTGEHTKGAGSGKEKVKLLFVESICTEETIVRKNIRDVKLKSPDYKDTVMGEAVKDFLHRIAEYVRVYEPVGDAEDVTYIQLANAGHRIVACGLLGFFHSHFLYFLSNLKVSSHPIWLTRHGESVYNVQGRIGGDSSLSPRGEEYARRLGRFIQALYPKGSELEVWTSTLRRTQETARFLGRDIVRFPELDEINAGRFNGYTYEGIAAVAPEEYEARKKDKFTYRYPQGESYQDLVHRLEPVLLRLLGLNRPVLIIGHQAILRVVYAYLTDISPQECPGLRMSLGSVVQLTARAYGCEEVRHELM